MLCIGGAFVPFYTLYQNVAISNGRSDIYMFCNIAQIVLQLVIIGFFYHLGINTMVMVYTLFTIAWLFVWQWTARRIIGLRIVSDGLYGIQPTEKQRENVITQGVDDVGYQNLYTETKHFSYGFEGEMPRRSPWSVIVTADVEHRNINDLLPR